MCNEVGLVTSKSLWALIDLTVDLEVRSRGDQVPCCQTLILEEMGLQRLCYFFLLYSTFVL